MYRLVTRRLVIYRLVSVANRLRRVLSRSLIYYNIGLDNCYSLGLIESTTTYIYLERTKRTTRTRMPIGTRDRQ